MITTSRTLMVAVAISAAFVATASASTSSTTFALSAETPTFYGTLRSPHHDCLSGRTVHLYRVRLGKRKLLGSDESGEDGKWRIPVGRSLIPGKYFATVAERGKCGAAKSDQLFLD